MTFVIKQTGVSLTQSGLKKLQKDAMLAPGVLSLLDFTNPATNDGGATTTGKGYHDLVTGVADTTASAPNGITQWAGGGSGSPSGIRLLNTQAYLSMPAAAKFAATDLSGLVIMWIRVNTSTALLNGYIGCGDTVNGTEVCQYTLAKNAAGSLSAGFNTSPNSAPYTALALSTLHQVAIDWTASASVAGVKEYWLDGVLKSSSTVAAGSTLIVPTANPRIGQMPGQNNTSVDFVVYRVMAESLTQSGRTGSAVIAADYAANHSRLNALG